MVVAESEVMTALHFSCACQSVRGSVTIPTSELPLPFDFCHCNTCRHQTGLLGASYLTLPEGSTKITFNGPLSNFKSSDTVTRTFCSHCGANVYVQDSNEPRPDICTGVLDRADGVVTLRNHIFVPDSKDGGLSSWIPDIPMWKTFSKPHHQSEQLDTGQQRKLKIDSKGSSELHAHCQCGGVQFKITRPNQHSRDLLSPYSDLCWADVTGNTLANKEDSKWWLCAEGRKYLAGTCACRSCRLASGFDVQMWAFVPKSNILQSNDDSLDLSMGSLKVYESSRGIHRHFCGTCGATVFWRGDERPELIDVSVGLLDAEEGARADSWLEWRTDRVSFEEEAQNKELISKLGAGLKRWGNTA